MIQLRLILRYNTFHVNCNKMVKRFDVLVNGIGSRFLITENLFLFYYSSNRIVLNMYKSFPAHIFLRLLNNETKSYDVQGPTH